MILPIYCFVFSVILILLIVAILVYMYVFWSEMNYLLKGVFSALIGTLSGVLIYAVYILATNRE